MPSKGSKLTEEHRRIISEAQKGRELSRETKTLISEKLKEWHIAHPEHEMPEGMRGRKEHILIAEIEHKHCPSCDQVKTLDNFPKNKRRWDGLHTNCKTCHSEQKRNKYAIDAEYREKNNRAAMIRSKQSKLDWIEYKGSQCTDCGLKHRPGINTNIFQFHHLDPAQKDFAPAEKRSWSFERVKPELDKCVMLCGNCHAMRHELEWNTHGRKKKT